MKSLRNILTVGLILVPALAIAKPTWLGPFQSTYKTAKGGCTNCHTGGKALNAYGKDVKKALKGSKNLTPAALKSLDMKDSDKDGVKNGAELKKGTNPGDPKSK